MSASKSIKGSRGRKTRLERTVGRPHSHVTVIA